MKITKLLNMTKTHILRIIMNRFALPIFIIIYSIFAILFHSSINDLFLRFMVLLSGCFYLPWSIGLLWLEIGYGKSLD